MNRKAAKSLVIVPEPLESEIPGASATRIRTRSRIDLEDPGNRASLALECWRLTGEECWLRCAWYDAMKGYLSWDDLCRTALGIVVDPPALESACDDATSVASLPHPGTPGLSTNAKLLGAALTVEHDVMLRVEVEQDSKREVFVVTAWAPTLFGYSPYVEEVRPAIAGVVARHQADLEAMFARMG